MLITTTRCGVPTGAGELARRTTLGVLVVVVALLFVGGVVSLFGVELGATGATNPFALGPLFGSAIFAGIGAAVASHVAVTGPLVAFVTGAVRV